MADRTKQQQAGKKGGDDKKDAPAPANGASSADEEKRLATRSTTDVATATLPRRDGETAPQADPFADEGAADATLPRIKLLQPTSAESIADPKIQGQFYNSVTKELLGQKIQFIPFKHFLTRVRLDVNKGLVCRSTDLLTAQMVGGQTKDGTPTNDCSVCVAHLWPDKRAKLGDKTLTPEQVTKGPECSLVDNFLAVQVVEDKKPEEYPFIVLQFMRTSSKAAKDLKGIWMASGKPIDAMVYRNTAIPVSGRGNAYYRQDVGNVRFATEEEREAVGRLRALIIPESILKRLDDSQLSGEDIGEPIAPAAREDQLAKAAQKNY